MPKELSTEQINALRNREASKGIYRKVIEEFVNSDSQGVDLTDDFPGKKLESAANGLKRITKKDFPAVTVVYVSKYADEPETLALIKS